MTEKYILNEQGNPVVERDLMKWARWFELADREIARDAIGNVTVSTVFLGLDHSFSGEPPVLFETIIIGGTHGGYMKRYANRVAALAGHDQAMVLVRDSGDFTSLHD